MSLRREMGKGIRRWMDALAANKARFRRRRKQGRTIAEALQAEEDVARVAAANGPTGVGKSIA